MRILSTKAYRAMKDKIISLELNLRQSQRDYNALMDKYNDVVNSNDYLKSENEHLKHELM